MAALLVALVVAGLAGWGSDWTTLAKAATVLPAALAGRALVGCGGASAVLAGRVLLALAAPVLVLVTGIGSAEHPTLGWPGFAAFHAVVLGYCGWVLRGVLRGASRSDRVDEQFLGMQLWLFNLALVAFVFQAGLGVMAHHASLASAGQALLGGLVPMSLVLLAAMVVRLTGGDDPGPRRAAWAVACAALLAIGAGGARWAYAGWAARSAEDELARQDLPAAARSIARLRGSAGTLASSSLARREAHLRSRLLQASAQPGEALTAQAEYLKRCLAPADSEGEAVRVYLDAIVGAKSLDGLLTYDEAGAVHGWLARRPAEEEALLCMAAENGQLEPLIDRYAWSGFPALTSPDRMELALMRLATAKRTGDGLAEFCLGLLCLEADRKPEAQRYFAQAASRRSADRNVQVLTDRCQETEGLTVRAAVSARAGRIGASGLCRFAYDSQAVWLPLEVLAGRVELRLDLRPGKAVRGATVQVYLDDRTEAAYAGRVASAGGAMRAACSFAEPGWHRVRVECSAPLRAEGSALAADEHVVVFGGIEVAPAAPAAPER